MQCPSCFNRQSPNKWGSRKYWVNVDNNYKYLFCVKNCLHSYFNLQTAWFALKKYFFHCSVALSSSSYLDSINISSVLNRGFSGFKTSWWPLVFHQLLDCMLPAILVPPLASRFGHLLEIILKPLKFMYRWWASIILQRNLGVPWECCVFTSS